MDYRIATDSQLALLLKSLRRERKLTQAQLGEKLGISQRMVAKLEAHPEVASFARVFHALSAMGVDIVLRDRQASVSQEQGKKNKAKAVQW